jgi:hypothetical protein
MGKSYGRAAESRRFVPVQSGGQSEPGVFNVQNAAITGGEGKAALIDFLIQS